jgi:hypothetical protein
MMTAIQRILHLTHTQREALLSEVGNHLRRDRFAVRRRGELVVGGDTGHETHGEVGEDGDKAGVFVESREGFGGELRKGKG